jgi:hypothetical protein
LAASGASDLAASHFHGILILVTSNKFIASVIVTGDNCSRVLLSPAIIVHRCLYCRRQQHRQSLKIRDKDYSPVSTPVNSLSPVLLTPVLNNDTGNH